MKLIVGIDLGTNTTIVRYKWVGSDSITAIKDADGASDIIPTVIFRPESEDAKPLYGRMALSRYVGGEEGKLITNFKMGLISSDPALVEESKSQIREFMAYVYSCFANQTLGIDTSDCDIYVSYPAKWPSSLAKFMKDVVKEAGFPGVVHGVFEPVAAVQNTLKGHVAHFQTSGLLTVDRPLNILMLDMGAGTSDIYIFQLTMDAVDGKVSVAIQNGTSYPSVDDPSLCGGREIDEDLRRLLYDHLKKSLDFDDEMLNELFKAHDAKIWKDEHLSNSLKSGEIVGLPQKIIGSLLPMKKFIPKDQFEAAKRFTINRASFEEQTKSHWAALYKMIESAMELHESKYGIGVEDIDLILLTGGHSAWYTVPKLFNGEGIGGQIAVDHTIDGKEVKASHFTKIEKEPWRIITDALPHESVARGLVLHHEGIDVPATASNNVWIRMRVNDRESELVQVIKMGQILPIKTQNAEMQITFENQRLTHVYDFYIDVFTGKTQDSAEVWSYKRHFDDRLGLWGASVLTGGIAAAITLLVGVKYDFKMSYNFTMDVDGIVHFESQLKKDREKPIEIKF